MDTPRPIGYWLGLVDRLIDERFASTLEDHGVTRRQWQLLNVLRSEAATEERLDAAVAPLRSTPSLAGDDEASADHLAELVDSAWVSHADGTYTITERGAQALDKLSEVVAVQRTAASAGVSPEEYERAVAVLERMARNLGWSD